MQFEITVDDVPVRVTIDEATGDFTLERFDQFDDNGDLADVGSWEVTDDSSKVFGGNGWFETSSEQGLLTLIFKKLTERGHSVSHMDISIEQHPGGYLITWSCRRGDPMLDHVEPMTEIVETLELAKERLLECFDHMIDGDMQEGGSQDD